MNLDLLSNQAIGFHRNGNLAEAERLYLQILAVAPGNFNGRHLLGVLRHQQGRNAEAAELIGGALKINPNAVEALSNYGLVLQALGRFDEALSSLDKALALKSDSPAVLNNRGNVLRDLRRFEEALANYNKALAVKRDYAEALDSRGTALLHLNRPKEALESYDQTLAIRPNNAETLYNRGTALLHLNRPQEALASYDKALAIKPSFLAWNSRGNILRDLRRCEEALASYNKALALKPDSAEALNNRGSALRDLKRLAEALTNYDKALSIKPDYAEALNNRAVTLSDLGRFEEALVSLDKALAIQADHAGALNNRGNVLRDLKRYAEALASYDKALEIQPNLAMASGNRALLALDMCACSQTAKITAEIKAHAAAGEFLIAPFTMLGYSDDASLQLDCAKHKIRDIMPIRPQPLWDGKAYQHNRIRIAYLSADFNNHATAVLMAELFELHDRAHFEILAISYGPDDGGALRARLVRAFDKWYDVQSKSDIEVAKILHMLEVDIAVDLKGYTTYGRPLILAHRPCPVQVNYLGYPGTMGADFIDYVIADQIVAPFRHQAFFAEKIVHLPDSYQVNDSNREIAEALPMRGHEGLPEAGFVFCCFNNNWKITAPVFAIWMRLLKAVPNSVLWLLAANPSACANLRQEAAVRGIDPKRLIFATRVELGEHLSRHRLADLFLDTLPFNAHTTASDALWAGLPLLTRKGQSFAGRVAASLLEAVGLPELITDSWEDYEALALKLANDPALLQRIRQKLSLHRQNAPLFDTDRFRRHIESAYTTMWKVSQRGGIPESFRVEPVI